MNYEVRDDNGPLAQFVFMQDTLKFMERYPITNKRLALWCMRSGKLLNPEVFAFKVELPRGGHVLQLIENGQEVSVGG